MNQKKGNKKSPKHFICLGLFKLMIQFTYLRPDNFV